MVKRRAREYEADGIVVEYDAARCIHAARCVGGLPSVFDAEARPWIRPGEASPEAVAEVVRSCPTGALRYRRTDGGAAEQPAEQNSVHVVADGPLHLRGRLRLELPDGEQVDETRVALCRCGASRNKPFCDNSHVDKGFSDPGQPAEHRLGSQGEGSGAGLSIRPAPNGPLLVEGPVVIVCADGEPAEGGKAALCRCGASASKPYCDGSHVAVGFEAS